MNRLFFILFLLAFQIEVFCQSDFRKGFIIKNSGDSLYGLIDYRGDYLMARECRFKENEKAETLIYKPQDLKAFRFLDSKYYVSRSFEGESYFFEFIINGELDVLYLRESGSGKYFVQKDSLTLKYLPFEEGIRIKDDKPYKYQSTIHNGILRIYTNDAPELRDKVNEVSQPSHSNMIRLAREYHNLVCETEECIVYEKKKKVKLSLEIVSAFSTVEYSQLTYFNNGDLQSQSYMQNGLIAHFWMPQTSEKIFLRTGATFMWVDNDNHQGLAAKFPLMIEYLYPKYRIRPHIAYGLNFYSPYLYTSGLNTGLNFLLTEQIHLTFNYDIEFISIEAFPLAPKYLFSNSFGGGIYYRF